VPDPAYAHLQPPAAQRINPHLLMSHLKARARSSAADSVDTKYTDTQYQNSTIYYTHTHTHTPSHITECCINEMKDARGLTFLKNAPSYERYAPSRLPKLDKNVNTTMVSFQNNCFFFPKEVGVSNIS